MYLERLPANPTPRHQEEPGRLPAPAPARLSPQAVIALQRSAGNAAVSRALAREPAPVQAQATPSGDDWSHVWDSVVFLENGVPTANFFRQIGELGRIVPLFGGLSGAAADTITIGQDLFGPTWQYEAPITHTLLVFRGVVNLLNNALGHLNYVSQLTQDAVAPASGGTASPFTLAVNEVLALIKFLADVLQATVDSTITTFALWNAYQVGPPAPGNQEQFDAWMDLAINYEANLFGDVVGMVFDAFDAVSAGAAHANTVSEIATFFEEMDVVGRAVFDWIVMELQGQLNLRGGDALEGIVNDIVPPPAVALDGAIFTLRQMQGAHQTGDQLLGDASGMIGDLAARANEVATGLLDGQDPFAFVREQCTGAVDHLSTRIAALSELGQAGANSAETTDSVLVQAAQARAALEGLEVPQDLGVDLGEGMLADAGEAVLGAGAELAGQGIQSALNVAKQTAFDALDVVEQNAGEIGDFMRLLAEQSARQTTELEAMLARLEEALGRSENFEKLFETLIEQALSVAGVEADVDLDALHMAWDDAGRWIDEMLADFESRRDGGPPLPVDEAAIRSAPRLAGGGQSEEP